MKWHFPVKIIKKVSAMVSSSFMVVMMREKVLHGCVSKERYFLSSTGRWHFPVPSDILQEEWGQWDVEIWAKVWVECGGKDGDPCQLCKSLSSAHLPHLFFIKHLQLWLRLIGDIIRRDCEHSCCCLADCQHFPNGWKYKMMLFKCVLFFGKQTVAWEKKVSPELKGFFPAGYKGLLPRQSWEIRQEQLPFPGDGYREPSHSCHWTGSCASVCAGQECLFEFYLSQQKSLGGQILMPWVTFIAL